MAYLRNSILEFEKHEETLNDIEGSGVIEHYIIEDYTSSKLSEVYDWVETTKEDYFSWYQLQNNSKLEKVALDLYDNPDYWDILLVINHRNPLFELPYDTDTLLDFADAKVASYVENIYGRDLSAETELLLTETYQQRFIEAAEKFRVIRIVKPERIHDFLQKGYELGYFGNV